MTDIILHHYETSPYAEKVRLGLGLKGLAWASVEIPVIMPKPDLTALTGGYRKTPVLQIGADLYCDSQLMVTVTPDDTGRDPVVGELVASSADEIVIRRSDAVVGEVCIHFPRAEFVVASV